MAKLQGIRRNAEKAYVDWLSSEIQAAIYDSRPNIEHNQVLAEMNADLAKLETQLTRRNR